MDFIPAQESAFFRRIFRVYVKWLFKRKFSKIWIHHAYKPGADNRTVYFLNHTSWWDGLIPFLLNEYRFGQQGRAMMEHRQMQTYPFFKRLGVFSVKPGDRSHTLASLRYAVESMKRPNAALFIYPEGEIVPAGLHVKFRKGIGWLRQQLPETDFVPVGIHMHTIRNHKPELHLWVGHPAEIERTKELSEIITLLERKMDQLLGKLRKTAGFDDSVYTRFF